MYIKYICYVMCIAHYLPVFCRTTIKYLFISVFLLIADWKCLMLVDADWHWLMLMLIDADDLFWLTLIGADWRWLMLIDSDLCWCCAGCWLIDAYGCWLILVDVDLSSYFWGLGLGVRWVWWVLVGSVDSSSHMLSEDILLVSYKLYGFKGKYWKKKGRMSQLWRAVKQQNVVELEFRFSEFANFLLINLVRGHIEEQMNLQLNVSSRDLSSSHWTSATLFDRSQITRA